MRPGILGQPTLLKEILRAFVVLHQAIVELFKLTQKTKGSDPLILQLKNELFGHNYYLKQWSGLACCGYYLCSATLRI
jgi:hypothetical protein